MNEQMDRDAQKESEGWGRHGRLVRMREPNYARLPERAKPHRVVDSVKMASKTAGSHTT